MTDNFEDELNQMIHILRDYNPGSITLENIMRICQTLELESFVEELDEQMSSLSTASTIIVIDIDFNRVLSKVTDVKLVLASNFDSFNYFTVQENAKITDKDIDPTSTTKNQYNNILLNSLTQYSDLKQFYKNLQFLYLLDKHSKIDIDNNVTTTNSKNTTATSTTNTSSNNIINTTNNNMTGSGKFDLFKYYTDLEPMLVKYLNDSTNNNIIQNWSITVNLNNEFGIYFLLNGEIMARLTFENTQTNNDATNKNDNNDGTISNRLFEYIYSEDSKIWINEKPEIFTNDIQLILECNEKIWFPKSFIPNDLIHEMGDNISPLQKIINSKIKHNLNIIQDNDNKNYHILNNFTTELIQIDKFNLSNDNINLLLDLLNWIHWYNAVLLDLFNIIEDQQFPTNNTTETNNTNSKISSTESNFKNFITPTTTNISENKNLTNMPPKLIRRRSSTKNKRPSISESTMFKDEGLHQFNLQEIMSQPTQLSSDNDEALIMMDDDRMDIDNDNNNTNTTPTTTTTTSNNEDLTLMLCEDQISLSNEQSCSFYETTENWLRFSNTLKEKFK